MAYASSTDVQNEFKYLEVGASFPVTSTLLDQWLSEAQAEIHSIIGVRYVVPVTADTDALNVLKTISIWLVKDRLRGKLEIKDVEDKVDQDVANKSLRERALEWLEKLASGEKILTGATLVTETATHGGVDSYLRSEDIDYEFQTGKDQW